MIWQWLDVTRAARNMAGDWSTTKLLIVCLVIMHWTGHRPPLLYATLLMAAAFGKSTFEAWIQRGTWSATDTTTDVTERRITITGEPGVDPAP